MRTVRDPLAPAVSKLPSPRRWAWVLPVAALCFSDWIPQVAMENAYVFAAFWLTGAVIGYIWQALSPRRLEERTLLWAGITLAVVVLMALTDGSPSELAESANQIVTMWGILCGLIERGASDVRRRRAT